MDNFLFKQTASKPLFPNLMWSQPENRNLAGKLLIVGGNAHDMAAPAKAFASATNAGIGTARVILPDSLQKNVGKVLEAGEFAPSTPSGSFARKALVELLSQSQWADGVLLAGDMGRNSETAILLDEFAQKYAGQLTITQDALDYFTKAPLNLLNRADTLMVASFAQLQKIATAAKYRIAVTYEMDLLRLIELLHNFSLEYKAVIVVKKGSNIIVAADGQVSSTKLNTEEKIWRVATAASAATWWLQNPSKTFEAITTSLV